MPNLGDDKPDHRGPQRFPTIESAETAPITRPRRPGGVVSWIAVADKEFMGPKITPNTARATSSIASGGVAASARNMTRGATSMHARKVRRRGSWCSTTLKACRQEQPLRRHQSIAPKLAALP